MLSYLRLKNYIFVDLLEIDFKKGLTILTGETGSGKSIIIEAIKILFGGKIKEGIIKKGKDFCEISAEFDEINIDNLNFENTDVKEIFENENSFIITRKIFESKTRFYINDRVISSMTAKYLFENLIEMHSQNFSHKIFLKDFQLKILDKYSGITDLSEKFKDFFCIKKDIEKKIFEIEQKRKSLNQKKDFLKFELEELEKIDFSLGEDEELEKKFREMLNLDEIKILSEAILKGISSALENILEINKNIRKISSFTKEYDSFTQDLDNFESIMKEMEERIFSYNSSLDIDLCDMEKLSKRLSFLDRLKKKYKLDLKGLLEYRDKIKKELNFLNFEDDEEISLKDNLNSYNKKLLDFGNELHKSREKNKKLLENDINQNLKDLYMEKAKFSINLELKKDNLGNLVFNDRGFDEINFLAKTNSGQDFMELEKILSGGELARIMLAIEAVISKLDNIDVLIFDEIDIGVGGKVAFSIGEKFKNISKNKQILSITHSPQVAAFGDNNKLIKKYNKNDETDIKVLDLDYDDKIKELAKMLGGKIITDMTLKNAEDLLKQIN